MDKLKTRVLFISLIMLALVSISAVAAADSVNDDISSANQEDFDLSEETNDVEQLGANAIDDTDSNEPLTAGEPGNFTELQGLIDAASDNEVIQLEKDYILNSGEKPILINKTITIDGKGHTIDANHLNATLAAISKITLKNIVFINGNCSNEFNVNSKYYFKGTVNINTGSIGSTIENCTFKDNEGTKGGAVYWAGNDGKITNSRFENNAANSPDTTVTSQGGAVYWSGKNALIENSNFTDNHARYMSAGGAIYFKNVQNPLIIASNFNRNTVPGYGNQNVGGGAIYYFDSSNGRIINSNFTENAVNASGGAILFNKGSKNNLINGSSFINNTADGFDSNNFSPVQGYGGGAIYWIGSNGKVENTNFTDNSASSIGGAIYYKEDATNQSIISTSFTNNSANLSGGTGISYARGGGAIYCLSSNVTISKSNFTENWANASGGAIFFSKCQNHTITDSSFSGNIANATSKNTGGGAITFATCKYGRIDNVNFTDNFAKNYGGAVHYYAGNNQSIVDSSFSNNVANNSGGAICYYTSTNGSIENVKFTENSAKSNGGAIYYTTNANNQAIVDSSFSKNTANGTSSSNGGGAISYSSSTNGSIENVNFTENSATNGGAIYYSSSNNGSIENVKFTENVAKTNGGAIYTTKSTNMSIADSSFSKNNASSGGAIYSTGSNSDLEKVNFTDNIAKTNGGAIYLTTTNQSIGESTFNGNNATSGSAIYHNSGFLNISSTELLENQANAASLSASAKVEGFDVTISTVFKGKDNLLNAIYTNAYTDVRLTDVDYWGAEDKMNTGASEVTPVASADASEEGTLVYKDDCEAGINITVTITDANGNFVKNVTAKTDIYGNINLSDLGLVPGKYKAKAIHKEDNYYTEIASNEISFEILKANSTVNGTNVTKVYNDTIEVTIASENATAVIYNITDDSTGQVVVANTQVPANGTVTIPTLDVGNYTVHYLTVVDDVYYNNATNTSKITVTPAPSAIGAENVTIKYTEDAVLVLSGENSTGIDSGSVVVRDSEGNVVETATVTVDGFKITISGLDAGNYTVSYNNTVDKNHESAFNVTGVRVDSLDTTVSNNSASGKPGKNVTVDFTVYDEKDNPVSNGTLTVTVDGKEYTAEVKDGKATFENIVLPATPGDYIYEVTYTCTNNYNPSVGQLNLTVQKVDVIVTLPEVINYTGAVVDIVVDVVDEYGNIVNEGTVTLTIDWGTKLSDKLMATAETHTVEVSNGKATFSGIALGEPGTYPSKAEYSGSDYYNEAENKSDVIVLPLNTTTESQDVSGKAGDKKDITADIVDQNGNPVKNGTAVLKLNGKEYTAEVKDGKATFKDVELPSESTEATIDYLGNEYYNPSSTTIKVTINEEPEPEPEPQPEPVTPVSEKTVPVIPAAGNPIALVLVALLALVSTVSFGRKK